MAPTLPTFLSLTKRSYYSQCSYSNSCDAHRTAIICAIAIVIIIKIIIIALVCRHSQKKKERREAENRRLREQIITQVNRAAEMGKRNSYANENEYVQKADRLGQGGFAGDMRAPKPAVLRPAGAGTNSPEFSRR